MAEPTRRQFLKILGLTAATAAIAPKVLIDLSKPSLTATLAPAIPLAKDAEIIQVTGIVGTVITVTRGYGGTIAKGSATEFETDAASAALIDYGYLFAQTEKPDVIQFLGAPLYQNCDLGRDHDRPDQLTITPRQA